MLLHEGRVDEDALVLETDGSISVIEAAPAGDATALAGVGGTAARR